jgi:ribonuclease T2
VHPFRQSLFIESDQGYIPALDCKHGVLNGASYYYNLRGSVIDGTFIPIGELNSYLPSSVECLILVLFVDAPKSGTCPSNGIAYHPK